MKCSESLRIIGLVMVYLAPIGAVEGAEICFRGDCTPVGSIVCLGDLADVLGADADEQHRLSAIHLFSTPATGTNVVVTTREVTDRLAVTGIDISRHVLSGANRISVRGPALIKEKSADPPVSDSLRSQAESRVRTVLIDYLAQVAEATRAWQIQPELSDAQVRAICRSGAKPMVTGGNPPWTGSQQFTITLTTADSSQQITVSAAIVAAAPIVMATRAIARGERLAAADVRLAVPEVFPAGADTLSDLENVIGREVKRSLSANSPVSADDIQSPVVVRKRDVVTVYVRSPGIRIRTTARATEDGALGDLITVESLTERNTFFARVSGAQQVEVYARAPQANLNTTANLTAGGAN